LVVIVSYFALVLFVGLWSSRQNRGSAGGYFLAGRNMNWIPVGASLFASNIGSLHFVGLAGSGAASGIAIGMYEINAMFVVLLLGYIFLPVYISSGVFTMPEYLKRRFGGKRIQMYMAVLALLVYIFTKISADLYAGALFIEQSLGWDIYPAILLLLAIAAIFTVAGGLTAVIWTDLIQTVIMLFGAFVLMIISFQRVGGLNGLVTKYPLAIANTTLHSNSTCGYPRDDYMKLFRDPAEGDLPWPGLFGLTINSVIVQRALAGKTFDHSKMGCILCGYLKMLPLFLLVFPGMIARILFTDTVGCSDPDVCMEVCGSRTGARGMMLAVMMSALMSSLTSIFNSSATIFAMDVVFVVVLVVISIVWIPILKASQGSQLFVYIQEVSSFLQPPICAVFLLGLFWERFNEKGAFVSLVIGMTIGLIRFAVQYSYTVPECGSAEPDPTPAIVRDVHYLYFSALLFVITGVVAVVVTLVTKPVDTRCIQRLTWWTRHSKQPCWDVNEWSRDPQAYASKMAAQEKTRTTEPEDHGASRDFGDATLGDAQAQKPDRNEFEGKADQEVSASGDKSCEALGEESVVYEIRMEDDTEQETSRHGASSVARRALSWICGVEDTSQGYRLTSHGVQQQDMVSIVQDKRWQIASNVLAV
ncbi:hypothetical protein BaRGS_00039533, partial [Batillaria attramentaria]